MSEHHHPQTRPPASEPTKAASPATQPGPSSAQQQQHHHHHDEHHTLYAAVAAAVSQPGTEAGERSEDFESMNYQAGCEDPDAAVSEASSVPSQQSDQVTVKNKRPFTVVCSVAKRAKFDHSDLMDDSMCDSDFESDAPATNGDHMLVTPAASPVPSPLAQPRSSSKSLRKTAYRRMRSKSLPDINLLSLQAPETERRSRRHRHHHRSIKLLSLLPSLPYSPAPPNYPPVNLQGLRELDLQEIYKNPQLRHDIVFDPQLQFRPNLDGERGRKKKQFAERYWSEVVWECHILIRAYNKRQTTKIKQSSKLVGILTSLREILVSLLPPRDRSHLEEMLDLELQIQQLEHVTFDFVGLANRLASVFKSYCAPMRDFWVDQMLTCISNGVLESNAEKLVDGLRMIFTILEAMKLDVANHQIRALRPVLVDSAVEFEQEYFAQKIQRGKVDVGPAMDWYKSVYDRVRATDPEITYLGAFVSGLIGLFSSRASNFDKTEEFPVTFGFDGSRLRSLKSDIAQITCLQQCLTLYRQLIASCSPGATATQQDLDTLKSELLVLVADDDTAAPVSLVPSTISTTDNLTPIANKLRWSANSDAISVQIARHVKQRFPSRGLGMNAMVDLARGWLVAHLNSECSSVYRLVEDRILADLESRVKFCLHGVNTGAPKTWKPDPSLTTVDISTKEVGYSQASKDVAGELNILAGRICLLGDFHWNVFADYYITGVMSH